MAQDELIRLRQGTNPTHYCPMSEVAPGVCGIKINIDTEWRVMYVANRKEVVYVQENTADKQKRQGLGKAPLIER